MSSDKNKAIVAFLQTYDAIKNNRLYFNFGTVETDANQVQAATDDVSLQTPYIDGSVQKRYTCAIDSFRSIAYNPIIDATTDENISDLSEVQSLLDWINAQADARNFPDFGTDCIIDEMKVLTTMPSLVAVREEQSPPTAIYRITVQIDYLDISKRIWK